MKYNLGMALRVSLPLLVLTLFQGAATTYYMYDTLGRVTQVVESDGTTTQYSHDANGNITSINRVAGTSVLSIGSVSTSSGATGSSETITGSGFSSIPEFLRRLSAELQNPKALSEELALVSSVGRPKFHCLTGSCIRRDVPCRPRPRRDRSA